MEIFPLAARLPDGLGLEPTLLSDSSGRPILQMGGQQVGDESLSIRKNEKASIALVLKVNPFAAYAVNVDNERLPLHTAMAEGTLSWDVIQLLLDTYPVATQLKDAKRELPLHHGLRALQDLMSDDEEGENLLTSISLVLKTFPASSKSFRQRKH